LGPLRPAPPTGPGWLFTTGQLAMTPRELAVWDISLMDRSLLAANSYDEMTKAVVLKSGLNSHYGLGLSVTDDNGMRLFEHGGEISGFLTENRVWPDQRMAVVVVVNADQVLAPDSIADRIKDVLLRSSADEPQAQETEPNSVVQPPLHGVDAEARAIFTSLQQGKVDALKLSDHANAYFTPQALKDAAAGLGPLGALRSFTPGWSLSRGGMTFRSYDAVCEHDRVIVNTFTLADGRFEQFLVLPEQK
jgi:hypothetical protein